MPSTTNAAAAERNAAGKSTENKPPDNKVHEKVAEKRRALGRGLESLLPGPRAVAPAGPARAEAHAAPAGPAGSAKVLRDLRAEGAEPPATPTTDRKEEGAALPRVRDGVAGHPEAALAPSFIAEGEVIRLDIQSIEHNPHQTRMSFDPAALEELAHSIRAQGVLQPILVRPEGADRYTLVLGERRLRASQIAGVRTIPAIIKRVSEQQAAEMTVVENLQRQDLDCVEQATAFSRLSKTFHLTQEEIGNKVGLSREAVSNYMRLLSLPSGVLEALVAKRLTFSHAKVLMQLREAEEIESVANRAIEKNLTVAGLQELVRGISDPASKEKASGGARWVDPNVKAAQRSLEEVLGMRVRIRDRNGRGRILIEYSTIDDFERVVGMLKGR